MMGLFSGGSASYTRAKAAAERDPVWAHWQYAADEWRWFDETEWRRAQTRIRLFLLLEGDIILLILSLVLVPLIVLSRGPSTNEIFFSLMLIPSVGFIALLGLATYRQSRKLHLARQQGPPEIQIGPLGITQPGGTIQLAGPMFGSGPPATDPFSPPMHTLRQVQVERTDRLLLRFDGWGGRNWPRTVRVPVPQGHEADAEQLARRFQQEIVLGR